MARRKRPFRGDIVCKRMNGVATVNVPHRLVFHSPTGFEWGYGGSGPSDLALNILAAFVDDDTAYRLHQDFKWDVIAKLPREGGVIKRADTIAWLQAHGVACPGSRQRK
ncbi:MAG: DUF6166 domain-containing protein [Bacillota bacterium]